MRRDHRWSKSSAETNLHHREPDVYVQARKSPIIQKKKKYPICSCLQEHLSYQGNSSKAGNHQQSPNSLSIRLQLSRTFLHLYRDAFKAPPRTPLPNSSLGCEERGALCCFCVGAGVNRARGTRRRHTTSTGLRAARREQPVFGAVSPKIGFRSSPRLGSMCRRGLSKPLAIRLGSSHHALEPWKMFYD